MLRMVLLVVLAVVGAGRQVQWADVQVVQLRLRAVLPLGRGCILLLRSSCCSYHRRCRSCNSSLLTSRLRLALFLRLLPHSHLHFVGRPRQCILCKHPARVVADPQGSVAEP